MEWMLLIFLVAVLAAGIRAINATIMTVAGLVVLGLSTALFVLAMKIPVFYFTLAALLIAIPALLIPPPRGGR